MPKFIKTEYGHIYEYVEEKIYPVRNRKFGLYIDNPKSDYEEIIKVADTIDELCDLFYLDRGGDIDINEFYDKHQFDVAKENYLEEIRHSNPVELKAYINTDKGLICVAKGKQNEEGELELI